MDCTVFTCHAIDLLCLIVHCFLVTSAVIPNRLLKQEPYMEGVNPFIKNNKHRMIMFLDELGVS